MAINTTKLKSKTTIAKIAMMTIDKEANEINSNYLLDWIEYKNISKNQIYTLKYAREDSSNKFNFSIPTTMPINLDCLCLCLCDKDKKLYIFKLKNNDRKIIIKKDKDRFELNNNSIIPHATIDLEDFEYWITYQRGEILATKGRIENSTGQNDKEKESAKFGTKEEFLKWYTKEPKKCCYCGIKEEYLTLYFNANNSQYIFNKNEKARQRGRYLEVERIVTLKNKNVYSIDNCALACYICNNAKSDFLSPKGFKSIARGINAFWNEILKKNVKYRYKKVIFPEKSKIWNKQ